MAEHFMRLVLMPAIWNTHCSSNSFSLGVTAREFWDPLRFRKVGQPEIREEAEMSFLVLIQAHLFLSPPDTMWLTCRH